MSSERLSITLPAHLAKQLRRRARTAKQPVSRLVAEMIERDVRRRIEEDMRRGYREWAEENRRLANEALPAFRDVLDDYPAR